MTDARDSGREAPAVAAGIAYMCCGVLFLVGLDVAARWLLESYALAQFVFLRSVFSMLLMLAFAGARGQFNALRTRRPGWHLLRSLLMAGSMLAFFHALRFIPLADIMIFALAAPLIATALSQPVLGERVGPRRWIAVLAGFLGVLVVLRPGTGAVHPAALFAVLGAGFYACLAITARKLAVTESTLALSLYVFAAPLVITGILTVPVWQRPDTIGWLMFFLCGLLGGLGILFINAAYQRAPVAVIVPFEYTALIWAAAGGFLFWGEIPGAYAWLGAAIISASGLFILYRETRVRARVALAAPGFPLQEAVGTMPEDGPAGTGASR